MTIFDLTQTYNGPLQAVVLDWAGTLVDYGCLGPAAVFVRAFAEFDIVITVAEARQFMGFAKRDHVRAICGLDTVQHQWRKQHGHPPDEKAITALYEITEPMMISAIENHCELIPGAKSTIARWRRRGLRIGSTTGYTAPMMAILRQKALEQGFTPDAVVCASDVPAGRPYPWMAYLNAIRLQIHPLHACVKVGDTVSDIQEGLNAGMWTIGLTQSGNELGLSLAEVEALPDDRLSEQLSTIEDRYREAGAHYVARGIWACDPIINDIKARLRGGEHPLCP